MPLARPVVPADALDGIRRVLASGRLVRGPVATRFEEEVAGRCQVPHAVACSSGSTALWLALRGLDVPAGGEVAVPAWTFAGVAHAVIQAGCVPVPLDVRQSDGALDPEALRDEASRRELSAAIVVDPFGIPVPFEDYEAVAREYGLKLIEDAACALGSTAAEGRPAGSRGDVATLSFHPRKLVTSGEGGMVLSRNEEVATRIRRLADHGLDRGRGVYRDPGINGRLGEVPAAIGRASLSALDEEIALRQIWVSRYDAGLADLEGSGHLRWLLPADGQRWNAQTLVLTHAKGQEGVRRARLLALECGVELGGTAQWLPGLPTLQDRRIRKFDPCPTARSLAEGSLAVPLFGAMGEAAVDRVINLLQRMDGLA